MGLLTRGLTLEESFVILSGNGIANACITVATVGTEHGSGTDLGIILPESTAQGQLFYRVSWFDNGDFIVKMGVAG